MHWVLLYKENSCVETETEAGELITSKGGRRWPLCATEGSAPCHGRYAGSNTASGVFCRGLAERVAERRVRCPRRIAFKEFELWKTQPAQADGRTGPSGSGSNPEGRRSASLDHRGAVGAAQSRLGRPIIRLTPIVIKG